MPTSPAIHKFTTASGYPIYRLTLNAFPNFWTYAYLILVEDMTMLIDTGSGFGVSNQDLEAGLALAGDAEDRDISLATLTHVLLTHGHIDHFGGLPHIRENSPAQVGVHELDKRTITNIEERLAITSQHLNNFLREAGVADAQRESLLETYRMAKLTYQSVPVDFTYEAMGMRLGPFEMLHVPGHCPGHVIIRLEDLLFTGDHVLGEISPHQAPESLTAFTGLGHYLKSLEDLRAWTGDVRLSLAGHGDPIPNLKARLDEIEEVHAHRLEKIQDILKTPHTIAELAHILFGEVKGYSGYNQLLALEEAGAHIEYLYQRGELCIHNLEDLEENSTPLPIYYSLL
ncbi:MAG: Hydroxyacylglutathione hydrolase [Chloroflexi bacterium]|nr:Hydroxyacylglutathione hydrolase [Chloroflexota bacterium]